MARRDNTLPGYKVDPDAAVRFRFRTPEEVQRIIAAQWSSYVSGGQGRTDDLATWNAFLQTLDSGERKIINLLFDVTEDPE